MKKILLFVLAAFLLIGIAACDDALTTEQVTDAITTQELTEAPTTVAPTTEAPTTVAPTTEVPTTEAPTTVVPTTEAPTTEAPTTELSAADIVDAQIASLSLTLEDLIAGTQLPQFSNDWSTQFFWTSDTPSVITNDGFVKNPPLGAEDATVTISVRAQEYGGSYSTSRDFVFVVEANPEVVISEVRNVEFIGTSEEYVVTDLTEFPLYYTEGGELPYVDIESFFNLVEGAVEPDLVTFTMTSTDVMEIAYSYTYFDDILEEDVTENYSAILNFTENTLTVNNFDFFAGYVASTESDYGEGLNYVDADYVDGQEVTFPLGNYDIDLTMYNDEGTDVYLMPLHVANIIFMSDLYYQVYYNGDTLYGVDTFALSDGDVDIINQIHVSSYNDLDMPKDVHLATYNALALVMDYFYGLKDERNYDTYYDKLSASMKTLIGGTDNQVYNKIFDLMYGMDDLHTSHIFYGYYDARTTSGLSIDDLGPNTVAFYEGLWAVQDLLTEKFGGYSDEDLPAYSLIDDDTVAVIHITGFSIDTPDSVKEILDGLPESVTEVVFDLSYNTGGNIGAVMRIFGYMTEDQYFYHSQNPADGSAVTYYLESDYVAYDYNWYVLTSSVTFSAANMFASMAKELGIPVIGQMSSGGASSIGSFVLPDGSAVMISTNNVLSTRIGNEVDGYDYLSVENGVPVDYFLSNVASDSQLIDAINQAKSDSE